MINACSTRRTKILQEGLGGIRDIILDGAQEVYVSTFEDAELRRRRAMGNNDLLKSLPRIIVEAVALVFIVSLAYILTIKSGNLLPLIPLLGTFAIGSQRLMPVVNQFYMAWSSVKGAEASLADVLLLLEQRLPNEVKGDSLSTFKFKKSISLANIGFRYSENGPWVLQGVNLELLKGSKIGLVGYTGSGKSTLLDVLMGLLNPQVGLLAVDGVVVDSTNSRAWQACIAHVPQYIYLADSTIAENIAFGVPAGEIDYDRIRYAAKRAQLDEFIKTCALGYETIIGERGIFLSGGQRQRIGIARALYKNASMIIFDEATNALDLETEGLIIETIEEISRDITVLMVAHRTDSLKICDVIYEVRAGKVLNRGCYGEYKAI